mmetsp:Transcript_71696/g.171242  ORF Transcript_71696/g.171242 Transcript_71696/m.171242 type:complete len:255 (-) Transcript_71696:195-959(-)
MKPWAKRASRAQDGNSYNLWPSPHSRIGRRPHEPRKVPRSKFRSCDIRWAVLLSRWSSSKSLVVRDQSTAPLSQPESSESGGSSPSSRSHGSVHSESSKPKSEGSKHLLASGSGLAVVLGVSCSSCRSEALDSGDLWPSSSAVDSEAFSAEATSCASCVSCVSWLGSQWLELLTWSSWLGSQEPQPTRSASAPMRWAALSMEIQRKASACSSASSLSVRPTDRTVKGKIPGFALCRSWPKWAPRISLKGMQTDT